MATTGWNRRFLASTRGCILSGLRRGIETVNDLAEATGLTDNAVRAHLTTLERDGLVQQAGTRAGTRRPNVVYELTTEASQFFPKPYAAVLQQLLEELADRLGPGELDETLRAVGRRLAAGFRHSVRAAEPRERVPQVLAVLEEIGGLAEVEEGGEGLCIRGFDCPLGAAMTGDRHVCRVAESLLADLLGVPVRERCRVDGGSVRCYFEVVADQSGSGASAGERPAPSGG